MEFNLDEVMKRGLSINRTGKVLDEQGNEYRYNESGRDEEVVYLNSNDLITVLIAYTNYIDEFDQTHDESSYPVCFEEWFMNDFRRSD